MNIGFYRNALIGDNLVALPAIYSIKALYPQSTLVVYTNTIGMELYRDFAFIDELFDLSKHNLENTLEHINSWAFDTFILTQPIKTPCALLAKSNAKQIISLLSPRNFYRPRFHTLFISRNFSPMPQYQRLLRLVREINPSHFDQHFHSIDFSPIRLKAHAKHLEFAQNFLDAVHAEQFSLRVMINPFSRTCSHSLTPQGWLQLIQTLSSSYPQILFIIPTYEGNPQPLDLLESNNLKIFHNTQDLFNLIALMGKIDLLISPSTGNIHIANNLKIPSIGIFSKRDTLLWRGEHMQKENLIIVPKEKRKLKKTEEEQVICAVLERFKICAQNLK